jgi:hypothetical protein
MSGHEITRDEIIVMGNEQSPVFCVAVVALNRRHRGGGEIKEWIHQSLPLDVANEHAKSEGQRRGLPVTIWAKPAASAAR